MPLAVGFKIGPYEIQRPLGAGGMGEVYRARDTRLGRDVAIKILPEEFSNDPSRKQRFEREAKAISSLNHPNICVLYDVGSHEGMEYLVMECLEGDTLSTRLARGPLPTEQVLKYGSQIAEALDRAHRSGVIHRDLKPGNIMLTATGAKLLDFGLAKPVTPLGTSGSAATLPSASPMTQEGAIVGTFQYMSPEQVEGKELDGRSDIFSLGAVLYEMATGKRAFEGKHQYSVASAILEKEPEPITALKPMAPLALERTIRKCLAKNPDERWQSASDLATQLRWISDSNSSGGAPPVKHARKSLPRLLTALLATLLLLFLIGVALVWNIYHRTTTDVRIPMRFSIELPSGDELGGTWWWYPSVAISRDGTQIAYVAHRGSDSNIYLRSISENAPRAIPGTEGADMPFFSPDGQWLGIYSSGKIKKVPLAGGPIGTVAAADFYGATWAPDGTIYFATSSELMKVPSAGGTPQPVLPIDVKSGELIQRFPELLPGEKALLFTLRNEQQPSFDEADVAALNLSTGERKILVKGGTNPHYIAGGYLIFVRAGVLLAVPFDPDKLEVKGSPVPVAENILENPRIGAGQYAISNTGMLVYIPGGVTYGEHELVHVDKAGNARPLTSKKRPYEDFTLSPDGKYIAATIEGPVTNSWLLDIARDTDTRFNSGPENRDPAWTPDGKRIAYSGYKDNRFAVLWKPLDGSSPEEALLVGDQMSWAWFFAPDGRSLVYSVFTPKGQSVGIVPVNDPSQAKLLFPNDYSSVEWAIFSPDGKWIAYTSDESGRPEVYVAPYPALAPRERISTDGGLHPLWSPDGRELYYRNRSGPEALRARALGQKSRVMAVSVETNPTFKAGQPKVLFEGPYFESGHDIAITPDGKGFILIRESATQDWPKDLSVILNWPDELRQRVQPPR